VPSPYRVIAVVGDPARQPELDATNNVAAFTPAS